jgi:hypothetical protein
MTMTFQETDTAAVCAFGVYCAVGNPIGNKNDAKQATIGGVAGVTAISVTHGASTTREEMLNFECIVPDDTFWKVPSGATWTDAFEVTVANSVLTWASVDHCRVSAGCVNANQNLGQSTINVSLGTTGVKTFTGTPTAQDTFEGNPSQGDKLIAVYGVSSTSTMTQAFSYKPSQAIVAPFVRGLTGWHRPTYPDMTDVAPAVMVPSG